MPDDVWQPRVTHRPAQSAPPATPAQDKGSTRKAHPRRFRLYRLSSSPEPRWWAIGEIVCSSDAPDVTGYRDNGWSESPYTAHTRRCNTCFPTSKRGQLPRRCVERASTATSRLANTIHHGPIRTWGVCYSVARQRRDPLWGPQSCVPVTDSIVMPSSGSSHLPRRPRHMAMNQHP
ncbi:hypothetical protein LZ30DRAFT_699365 [Colletotrichum cereale]|nr:hypothetical protein LZ30DRAFT_699365 [Colletotrichum cereale]